MEQLYAYRKRGRYNRFSKNMILATVSVIAATSFACGSDDDAQIGNRGDYAGTSGASGSGAGVGGGGTQSSGGTGAGGVEGTAAIGGTAGNGGTAGSGGTGGTGGKSVGPPLLDGTYTSEVYGVQGNSCGYYATDVLESEQPMVISWTSETTFTLSDGEQVSHCSRSDETIDCEPFGWVVSGADSATISVSQTYLSFDIYSPQEWSVVALHSVTCAGQSCESFAEQNQITFSCDFTASIRFTWSP